MTLDDFIVRWINKLVDVDGAYGAQCWDLVERYAQDVLNIPKEPWAITLGPNGSAREAWAVFDAHMQRYFDKIPSGQEQRGDIIVYDGHGAYTDGHIAICNGNSQVFEQNADPDHSPAHLFNRAPTYRLGSLRKKGGSQGGEIMPDGGTVDNAYLLINGRKATDAEKQVYTSKSVNSDDGLIYGKIFKDIESLQRQLKEAQNANFEPIGQLFIKKG